jgi:hypothetical protein
MQEVFIGKNVGRTANVQITDATNATTYIADGEIVILDNEGTIATSAETIATSPWIQIVQRSKDNLLYSSRIYGAKVTNYSAQGGDIQGTEQIWHVGYNGTAGDLDVSGTANFQITITTNHDDMQWSEQKQKNVIVVPKSVVGTSDLVLSKEIVRNQNLKVLNGGSSVKALILNSGAAADADSGGATTVAVTYGSPVIVYVASDAITAGAMVRLGATGSGRGTGIPVYTVKEAHPTIVNGWILDQPYMGPSNSALPNGDHGVVTPGANYGIRFVGMNLPFTLDFFKFKRTTFTIGFSGFGTTPLYKTQAMSYGVGDGRLVAEEESFCKGFQGALNRMTIPLPTAGIDADFTTTGAINTTYAERFVTATRLYECIMIEHYSQNPSAMTASSPMPQLVKIFLYPAAGQNKGAADDVATCLDAWMLTTPGSFAAIAGSLS